MHKIIATYIIHTPASDVAETKENVLLHVMTLPVNGPFQITLRRKWKTDFPSDETPSLWSFLLFHVNNNTGHLDWELNNLSRMGSWLPLLKLFHFQNCWKTTKQLSRPASCPATPAVHSPRCRIYMQNYGATASFFWFYWEIISEARHSAACESVVQYSALELMKSV